MTKLAATRLSVLLLAPLDCLKDSTLFCGSWNEQLAHPAEKPGQYSPDNQKMVNGFPPMNKRPPTTIMKMYSGNATP